MKEKKYKTTKQHFDIFQKEVRKWQKFFALLEWEFTFEHILKEGYRAMVATQLTAMQANFMLSTSWEDMPITVSLVKRAAFHEVIHVLLSEVSYLARQSANQYEVEQIEHRIINTLENTVFSE